MQFAREGLENQLIKWIVSLPSGVLERIVCECFKDMTKFPRAVMILSVKNRFSNPTKVQIGQDQYRKDVMNDHWEKALREGCHEKEQAWMDTSSTEKTNTKEDLARVMTKSRSKTQTVTNGCVFS